jgi:beta-1,4-mannosyl-glycoprotein beta-1,4-N-acetylglucosaminyltransferase
MNKIYDCFTFFNELDILEMRFNILDPVVDYFVLIEGNKFMNGQSKTSKFLENSDRFSNFKHKIIHKIVDLPDDFSTLRIKENPNTFEEIELNKIYQFISTTRLFNRFSEPRFGRSFYIKESPRFCLERCGDDDIILSSDCDEIPNPEILSRLSEFFSPDEFYSFTQTCYYYFLNVLRESHINNVNHTYLGADPFTGIKSSHWKGTKMASYKMIKNYSLNELRAQPNNDIVNGGWHFSYLGGEEAIKHKLSSGDTQQFDSDAYLSKIKENLDKLSDVIANGDKLTQVPFDESYPKYILDNLHKYPHLIK